MKTFLNFSICLFSFFISGAQVSDKEKQALLDFYHSTAGASWNISWDIEQPVSTWHGVVLDDDRVVGLDLGMNNLQGTLPASIENLSHLKELRLFFNQLNGELPKTIGNLTQLRVLDLNNNSLEGTLPKELGELMQLEELLLASNSFSGNLPDSLGNLYQLRTLVVFDNQLQGIVPASIGYLPKLLELVLAENNLDASGLNLSEEKLNAGNSLDLNNKKQYTQQDIATILSEDE